MSNNALSSATEAVASWTALPARRGLKVASLAHDDAAIEAAIDHLLPPTGGALDHYRLLLEPTGVEKRHILVEEAGEPLAVLSLRRRPRFWEPVAYQCMPGFVAPARSDADLARAIVATGLDVRMQSGLSEPLPGVELSYAYEVYQINLASDYRAHWRTAGKEFARQGVGPGSKSVKRALKQCENMEFRVDHPGDIAETVDHWAKTWSDDPSGETVAHEDRLRFWGAVTTAGVTDWTVRSLVLVDGDRWVAGELLGAQDDTVLSLCRDARADESIAYGNASLAMAIEWSLDQGFQTFDLAGGFGYKAWWAPVGGVRYAAIHRPPLRRAAGMVVDRVGKLRSKT